MPSLLDRIFVIGHTELGGEPVGVWTVVEGAYNPSQQLLTVTLDSFLGRSARNRPELRIKAKWLPPRMVVHERVCLGEACSRIKTFAQDWDEWICQNIPADLPISRGQPLSSSLRK